MIGGGVFMAEDRVITKRRIENAFAEALADFDLASFTWKVDRDASPDYTTYWFYRDDKVIGRAQIFIPTEYEGGHVNYFGDDIAERNYEKGDPVSFGLYLCWGMIKCRIDDELEALFAWANELALSDGTEEPLSAMPNGDTKETPIPTPVNTDEELPPPSSFIGKFGRDRDIPEDDVRTIVRRSREYQKRDGTVEAFYDALALDPNGPRYFAFETLKGWRKDPRFKDD
jgi:hypothetical protein